MLLEQNLRPAEREYAWQCPPRYRQCAIGGAGRQNESVEIDRIGDARPDCVKLLLMDGPHERLRPIVDAVAQAIEDRMEIPIVLCLSAEQVINVERKAGACAAIDLSASLASLVDYSDNRTMRGEHACSRNAGRTSADYGDSNHGRQIRAARHVGCSC